jgi:two-component system, LytTR family, response regulator
MSLAMPLVRQPSARPPPSVLLAGGAAGLWLIYGLIFITTADAPLMRAAMDATANVAPLAVLAVAARAVVGKIFGRPIPVQAAGHLALAAAFSLTWYGAAVVLLGLGLWVTGGGFHVRGFSGPALTWQVFQGVVIYSAVAAICYALRPVADLGEAAQDIAPAASPLERYLIREGEDFRPVDVRDIVTIAGAQDYSEVSTPSGRHLVRMSLGEFETRLDPRRFIRVHRSAIIQLTFLERAEPAGGGRMLAHMTNGERVPISRSGVRALRPLIV